MSPFILSFGLLFIGHGMTSNSPILYHGSVVVYDTIKPVIIQDLLLRNTDIDRYVYTSVEQGPEFIGGTRGLYTYISENIIYPERARKEHVEGRVFVKLIETELPIIQSF